MFLAILLVLLVVVLIVPLIGFGAWAVSTIVVGLIIGAFGRLVVPGAQPIGCLATLVAGLVGSLIGTVVGRAAAVGHLATVLLEVAAAAVLVAVMSRSPALGAGAAPPRIGWSRMDRRRPSGPRR